MGQQSLDIMSMTRFILNNSVKEIRISSLNHIFLKKDSLFLKYKMTVKELLNKARSNKWVEVELYK
jgi:hypothetical protein